MELKGKKIVVLGDSITQGIGVSEEKNFFVNRIAKWGECTVINHGIGGTRMAKQTNKFCPDFDDNDFCIRVEKLEEDADIVIVFGGTNDFGHGDASMGALHNRDPYTFYGACHQIMTRLYERYLGKTVIIMTPIHRVDEYRFYPDGHLRRCLKDYVDVIREMAEYYSLPLLDMYASSGIQPEIEAFREAYCPDGIHPNDAGHELIAKKLFAFLKAL